MDKDKEIKTNDRSDSPKRGNGSGTVSSAQDIEKTAHYLMQKGGLTAVYLAGNGQWFSIKENAEAHSNGKEIQEFNYEKPLIINH
jgi:hypothetical protein